MPQLDLLGTPSAFGIRWHYHVDPLAPLAPASLWIEHLDHLSHATDLAYVRVPSNVSHEAVDDLLNQTWEGYLFGEPGDLKPLVKARMKLWRKESTHRPRL